MSSTSALRKTTAPGVAAMFLPSAKGRASTCRGSHVPPLKSSTKFASPRSALVPLESTSLRSAAGLLPRKLVGAMASSKSDMTKRARSAVVASSLARRRSGRATRTARRRTAARGGTRRSRPRGVGEAAVAGRGGERRAAGGDAREFGDEAARTARCDAAAAARAAPSSVAAAAARPCVASRSADWRRACAASRCSERSETGAAACVPRRRRLRVRVRGGGGRHIVVSSVRSCARARPSASPATRR